MEKCESPEIKSWTCDYGYELIGELLLDSVQGSGFAALVEQKCDDLIGELVERDLFAKRCVETFKERQNVVALCKHTMIEDMVSTLSTVSQKFYIIPRNGIDENEVKMYGEFVYLNFKRGQQGYIDFTLKNDNPYKIKQLMEVCGFRSFLDTIPENWEFPALFHKVQDALRNKPCSMLYLSFYTT